MTRTAALLFCTALLVALTARAAGGAAPRSYYLALGDSISYGIQPDKVDAGLPPSGFRTGYVDGVAAELRKTAPPIKVVNYGCPGESTVSFARGGCPWLGEKRKLHDPFTGSQLNAALAFLAAHKGRVSPITLTLFGNDVAPLGDGCNDFACIKRKVLNGVQPFTSRLQAILTKLRAAAPQAVIVVTGPWNFDEEHLAQGNSIFRAYDVAMRKAASAAKVRYATLIDVFNPPGPIAKQRKTLCALTFICSRDDPHPTDAGYRAIADAVWTASGF